MATTYKVVYKNHCTPQEQVSSGGRFYLDSDCGKKLVGICETNASLTATGIFGNKDVTTTPVLVSVSKDFIFIKCTGEEDILLTLNASDYLIKLSKNESFCSEISTSASIYAKTASGTSTLEYFNVT